MPDPILSSPHQTRSLPRTQHPLASPRSPPRHTSPPKSALPLLITKNILPSPHPTPTRLAPLTPRHTRPPKSALIPPPHIDASLSNLDTWGRVYFVHFLDILNTSPCVQNCKIYRYLTLYRFFILRLTFLFVIFPKTLLFAYISYPIFLLQSPRSHLFIGIYLSDLDTWGRVCFVHFLDILNTSPSVQIGKVVLNVLGKRKAGRKSPALSFQIKNVRTPPRTPTAAG